MENGCIFSLQVVDVKGWAQKGTPRTGHQFIMGLTQIAIHTHKHIYCMGNLE